MDRRRRHRSQRGQVLVITALVATLLIGASALAVDLSVQTSHRRTLQNVTDVAALAGAHDLGSDGSTVSTADQLQAVSDALDAVREDMGWPSTWLTALSTPLPCVQPQAFADYGLTGYCQSVQYGDYTVTVSTPPYTPRSQADMEQHNVEVEMSQTTHNGLAGVIGFGSSTEGGHSVARHMLGGQSEGFALFSNTYVEAGNGAETVYGNVYANRYVQPQSSGQSSFCAQSTDGTDGYIILSAPQTNTDGQAGITPRSANPIQEPQPNDLCTDVQPSANGVYETGTAVQTHSCPASIAGVPDNLSYNSTVNACVTLPLTPPVIAAPPLAGNAYTITSPCKNNGNGGSKKTGSGVPGCWDGTFSIGPGIYDIPAACAKTNTGNGCWDLLISAPKTLTNVTFYLEAGAHMAVNLGGNGGTVEDTAPYNAGTGQANDGKLVVYGLGGSSLSVVGNNTTVTFDKGSIYMPGGTVDGGGSSAGALVMGGGQAVTDTWNVSTGNHPNPLITYDPSMSPTSTETFRLVE